MSLVKKQTETVVIQIDGIHDDFRNVRQDISSLRGNEIEEFEKISKAIQNSAQTIEGAIATRLDECGADIRNALSQHNSQMTGLMTNQTKQIEVLVSSTE